MKDVVLQQIEMFDDAEESYYVCDVGDIARKHEKWQLHFPNILPYYAVKANNSTVMLEVLAALGTGFDCASKNEMKQVLELGVSPERILLANPVVLDPHLAFAAAVGINLVVVDHHTQLHKIKKLHPQAKILLRIKAGGGKSLRNFNTKFGCEPKEEAPEFISVARSLGLNMVGVSFHVGTACEDNEDYRRAIAAAKTLFQCGAKFGYQFNILDIGGGFPGDKGTDITQLTESVNCALFEYFGELNNSVRVIAEPGRYYATSAFTLVTSIHLKKELILENKDHKTRHISYYINNNAYISFGTLVFKNHKCPPHPKPLNGGELIPSTIAGLSCEVIKENVPLPVMNAGDYILFENMGAYTITVGVPSLSTNKVYISLDANSWKKLKDKLPHLKKRYTFTKIPGGRYIGVNPRQKE